MLDFLHSYFERGLLRLDDDDDDDYLFYIESSRPAAVVSCYAVVVFSVGHCTWHLISNVNVDYDNTTAMTMVCNMIFMITMILRCGTNALSVQLLSTAKQILWIVKVAYAHARTYARTEYGLWGRRASRQFSCVLCFRRFCFTLVIVVFKNIIMTYCVIRTVCCW